MSRSFAVGRVYCIDGAYIISHPRSPPFVARSRVIRRIIRRRLNGARTGRTLCTVSLFSLTTKSNFFRLRPGPGFAKCDQTAGHRNEATAFTIWETSRRFHRSASTHHRLLRTPRARARPPRGPRARLPVTQPRALSRRSRAVRPHRDVRSRRAAPQPAGARDGGFRLRFRGVVVGERERERRQRVRLRGRETRARLSRWRLERERATRAAREMETLVAIRAARERREAASFQTRAFRVALEREDTKRWAEDVETRAVERAAERAAETLHEAYEASEASDHDFTGAKAADDDARSARRGTRTKRSGARSYALRALRWASPAFVAAFDGQAAIAAVARLERRKAKENVPIATARRRVPGALASVAPRQVSRRARRAAKRRRRRRGRRRASPDLALEPGETHAEAVARRVRGSAGTQRRVRKRTGDDTTKMIRMIRMYAFVHREDDGRERVARVARAERTLDALLMSLETRLDQRSGGLPRPRDEVLQHRPHR